mmetsp:Transcript_3266/g.13137  ORF Transcript_3266/g.13137 Transcript_3266/m.13137 type:complete len:260 (+) Transcript_3266:2103-2882(+)
MRACCFIRPCSIATGTPGRMRRNTSCTNLTCLQLDKNTSVLLVRWLLMNAHSVSIFFSSSHVATSCVSFGGVALADSACTARYSGFLRLSRARSFTDLVCVALKHSVWRFFGRFSKIALSVAAKPRSRMRSASSKTSTLSVTQSNRGVSSMCCNSRPGVATSRFILFTVSFSSLTFLPPISRPALSVWYDPASTSCLKICIASSRVGAMTSPPSPSCLPHFCRNKISSSGMTKAKVFPEPVFAAPSTSRPHSACGMVAL